MEIIYNVNFWVLLFCSLVGSVKASIEFDRDKQCFARGVDVVIGLICGLSVVHHFANELSLGLSAMVAVAGGASGAMIVEVFLQVLPTMAKKVIVDKVKKFFS